MPSYTIFPLTSHRSLWFIAKAVVTCLYRSKLCPSCEIFSQQTLLHGPGSPTSDMRASFPREAGKSKGQQLTVHPHHNLSNISTTPPSKLLPKVTSDAFHTIAMTTAIFGNRQHATVLEGESTQWNIIIIQMKGQLSSTDATVSRNKDWLMTSYSHDNTVATL